MKKHKLLAVVATSLLMLSACDEEEPVEEAVTESEVSDETPEEIIEEETEEISEEEEEVEPQVALPEEIEGLTLSDTRGDVTGNWRKAVTSNNVNMPENAIAYNQEYMEEGEIHHIVSFATNTTTMVREMGGVIYVDVTEYESGEEHSADTIGGGMLLKSYMVYPDSNEIVDLDDE